MLHVLGHGHSHAFTIVCRALSATGCPWWAVHVRKGLTPGDAGRRIVCARGCAWDQGVDVCAN
jgi:hypothetical protein